MKLNIKLVGIGPDSTHEDKISALRAAALEVLALNELLALDPPIPANPDAEQIEGYLGNCNSPPNEFGYVAVLLNDYRKLIMPHGVSPQSFEVVIGTPVEDVTDEETGEVRQVLGGEIVG